MAIYAIDFDNTLAITRFPEIVAPNKKMVAFAKAVKAQGHQIILWTSRAGADLENAVEWCRLQVITRSNGLCERCKARGIYKPGYIVHHKEYITPGNISNPNITLNLDNLEYVCEDCHNKEHKAVHTPMRYQYDANGNLLPPKENNKSDHTPGVQNLTPGKRTEGVTSKKLRKVARI